jgi:hypothetical protein
MRTGSLWVLAAVQVLPVVTQVTVAVTVSWLEPSAGWHGAGVQNADEPVIATATDIPVGAGFSVWVIVAVLLPLVAASVALMVQNPAEVPEM